MTQTTAIELTNELRQAMIDHAAAEAPRECCGMLVRNAEDDVLRYCRSRNLFAGEVGQDRFQIDPELYAAASDSGRIEAIVHSHPLASANPSMADRFGCERSGLPWLIVGWPSGVIKTIEPCGWVAPLVGREFEFGVLDCYTLIQDWYVREWSVALPDFEREDGFWERGEDIYREGFPLAGFAELPHGTVPQRGDVLLMHVRSEINNHGAVYLGDGQMLHHMFGAPSEVTVWGHAWQIRTSAVLRHRSRL
jgi:proteasome lid subunit RPN8/RPN11